MRQIIETVAMSNYEQFEDRASLLGLKDSQSVSIGFKCPKCETVNKPLEHGAEGQCPKCKLFFRLYGNGLHCSNKAVPVHPF